MRAKLPLEAGAGSGESSSQTAPRKPSTAFAVARWIPRAIVFAALAYWLLYHIPFNNDRYAAVAADAAIYAIIGLSLNIIVGYTGQLSLGHQGFVGIGAFTAAYTLTVAGAPFWLTFFLAAVLAGVFALVLGLVALRITGLYLALITLVFGLTLEGSLFEIPKFTNGGAGQPADRPDWLLDGAIGGGDGAFYLLCLGFLAVAVYIDWQLLRSKTGRALLTLKENERVASAFGMNVTAFKLIAFTLSGALAGVAGALLAYRIGIVTGSGFGFFLALTFVLMTVVGGLGSRVGVILGATLFATLDYLLEFTFLNVIERGFVSGGTKLGVGQANLEQFDVAFIGALGLLLTLTKYPGGIGQQIKPLTSWLAGKPLSLHGHKKSPKLSEAVDVRA